MNSPLFTFAEEESVKDALKLMRRKHIRRLAVKNGKCKITGIVALMSLVGNVRSDKIRPCLKSNCLPM